MTILIALSLLLVPAALASSGYGDPHAGYGNFINHKDLADAEDFLNRIDAGRVALLEKVDMLRMQQTNMLSQIDVINNSTLPDLRNVQGVQSSNLGDIQSTLEQLEYQVLNQEANLAGEQAMSTGTMALVTNMWNSIDAAVENNNRQEAILARTQTLTTEAARTLNANLQRQSERASDSVDELVENTISFTRLVNTRHCTVETTQVLIDSDTGVGEQMVNFTIPNLFDGVPTAYCAIQGFVSKLSFETSQSYAYGSYPDLHQNLALTLDCKAFQDRVLVRAFDQSRGTKNAVVGTFVQIKACSLGLA